MNDNAATFINFGDGMTPEIDDLSLGLMSRLLAQWNGGAGTLGIAICGTSVEKNIQLSPNGPVYTISLDLREAE